MKIFLRVSKFLNKCSRNLLKKELTKWPIYEVKSKRTFENLKTKEAIKIQKTTNYIEKEDYQFLQSNAKSLQTKLEIDV
ncbi:MAG: hypothetical protein NZ853_08890 [Leptospiraceae bacterium]|nr:hypothetical protein [Leptospiraceae bacterium]MDW7975544.1 hypothetical protein [Leptospiraceae bacterium]